MIFSSISMLKKVKLLFNILIIVVIGLMALHMERQAQELEMAKKLVVELQKARDSDSVTISQLKTTLEHYSLQLQFLKSETSKIRQSYSSSQSAVAQRLNDVRESNVSQQRKSEVVSEILYDDLKQFKKELGVK